jgi:hypothetical protein
MVGRAVDGAVGVGVFVGVDVRVGRVAVEEDVTVLVGVVVGGGGVRIQDG